MTTIIKGIPKPTYKKYNTTETPITCIGSSVGITDGPCIPIGSSIENNTVTQTPIGDGDGDEDEDEEYKLSDLIGVSVQEISTEHSEQIGAAVNALASAGKLFATGFAKFAASGGFKAMMDTIMGLLKKLPNNTQLKDTLSKGFASLGKNFLTAPDGLPGAMTKSLRQFGGWSTNLIDTNKSLIPQDKEAMKNLIKSDPQKIFDKNGKFYQQFQASFKGKKFLDMLDPEIFSASATVVLEGVLRMIRFAGTPIAGAVGGALTIEAAGAGGVVAAKWFYRILTALIVILPTLTQIAGPALITKLKEVFTKLFREIETKFSGLDAIKALLKIEPKKGLQMVVLEQAAEKLEKEKIEPSVDALEKEMVALSKLEIIDQPLVKTEVTKQQMMTPIQSSIEGGEGSSVGIESEKVKKTAYSDELNDLRQETSDEFIRTEMSNVFYMLSARQLDLEGMAQKIADSGIFDTVAVQRINTTIEDCCHQWVDAKNRYELSSDMDKDFREESEFKELAELVNRCITDLLGVWKYQTTASSSSDPWISVMGRELLQKVMHYFLLVTHPTSLEFNQMLSVFGVLPSQYLEKKKIAFKKAPSQDDSLFAIQESGESFRYFAKYLSYQNPIKGIIKGCGDVDRKEGDRLRDAMDTFEQETIKFAKTPFPKDIYDDGVLLEMSIINSVSTLIEVSEIKTNCLRLEEIMFLYDYIFIQSSPFFRLLMTTISKKK